MDEMLKTLYDRFYIPPELAELKRGAEDSHQLLIERLEKPERKLVLRIIDTKDNIAGQLSQDSSRRIALSTDLSWHCNLQTN